MISSSELPFLGLGRPIVMLTAYDAPTATIEAAAGVDILLVGDSVGTNVLGYGSPTEVTLADMIHHTAAVRRGAPNSFILSDLPYATYDTPEVAVRSARALVDAGANAVKIEGLVPAIAKAIAGANMAVCGHLGYTPQSHATARVQAKTASSAHQLLEESAALTEAGVFGIVLELVPEEVARWVTEQLPIITIGIGSGRHTTGQVLVVTDLVGMTERMMRHSLRAAEWRTSMVDAVEAYRAAVVQGQFPAEAHSRHMDDVELRQLLDGAK